MGIHPAAAIRIPDSGASPTLKVDPEAAYKNSYNFLVSKYSCKTIVSFISDLTVNVNTCHLKTGSDCRGEHTGKLNQLMRIEHELEIASFFARKKAFKNS
jgi:enolase